MRSAWKIRLVENGLYVEVTVKHANDVIARHWPVSKFIQKYNIGLNYEFPRQLTFEGLEDLQEARH